MKRWKTIGLLLFVAVLAACNPREARRMEAALEEARAVYGDGSLEVEVDTVLFIPGLSEAPAYFAGRKQYHKAALAALLNGYTERDFDKEAAMASFKDAERYGEKARDSLTVARAEYWMGKMLYNDYLYEEALIILKSSVLNFGHCYGEKALVLNTAACSYMILGEYDSTAFYLEHCLDYAHIAQSSEAQRKALNNFAVLYQLKGDFGKALEYLGRVKTCNENQSFLNHLNLATTYEAAHLIDSAKYYYKTIEQSIGSPYVETDAKCTAYKSLSVFAERNGDIEAALGFRKKYDEIIINILDTNSQKSMYRIQQKYDYEALQSAMSRKIIQRHRIILAFSVLLLFFVVIIIIQQHRHKQMLDAEENMKQQLVSMKEDLSRMVDISVLDALVVAQLKTIIAANRAKNRAKDPQNEWRPLFLEVMGGKEKTFEAAKEVVESAYPGLYSLIPEKYPDLSETETGVCLLSCFDLTNSQIAELLNLKTNTVNQARTSLRKKLNLNSEKLNEQLRKLVSK